MTVICPDCNNGKIFGMGCPGFKPMALTCPRCKGTGIIDEVMLKWIKAGSILRYNRLNRDIGLREEAKILKIRPSLLSEYERGVKNPNELNTGGTKDGTV